LLDDCGKVRPQYNIGDAPKSQTACSPEEITECNEATVMVEDTSTDMGIPSHGNTSIAEVQQTHPDTTNPLKRKLEQPNVETWLSAIDGADISEHLPSQPLLLKVVTFFKASFHHWIPYIHKHRLETKVSSDGISSDGIDLVLHALVAVSLRHMDPNEIFMDEDQIQQQTRISRTIVEIYSIRTVSIESLQALIFLVFDYVSTVWLIFSLITDVDIA
jgi:hypothetical protein